MQANIPLALGSSAFGFQSQLRTLMYAPSTSLLGTLLLAAHPASLLEMLWVYEQGNLDFADALIYPKHFKKPGRKASGEVEGAYTRVRD